MTTPGEDHIWRGRMEARVEHLERSSEKLHTSMETIAQKMTSLDARQEVNTGKIANIEAGLDDNTKTTKRVLAILEASSFGAVLVKWLAAVGAGIAAIWTAVHYGK